MTRVNLVPVSELSNLHLLAEYREISRISRLAKPLVVQKEFVLGTGHVRFFYDKGEWLRRRFEDEIVPELRRRGYNPRHAKYRAHPDGLNGDWKPRPEDVALSRKRVQEKLKMSKMGGASVQ